MPLCSRPGHGFHYSLKCPDCWEQSLAGRIQRQKEAEETKKFLMLPIDFLTWFIKDPKRGCLTLVGIFIFGNIFFMLVVGVMLLNRDKTPTSNDKSTQQVNNSKKETTSSKKESSSKKEVSPKTETDLKDSPVIATPKLPEAPGATINLAGNWEGTVEAPMLEYRIVMILKEKDSSLTGTTRIDAPPRFGEANATSEIKCTSDRDILKFQQTKFLINNSTREVPWKLIRAEMTLSTSGKSLTLKGNWYLIENPSISGKITLEKK